MSNLKWVIQNNLGRNMDQNLEKLIGFLEVQGVKWEHIPHIPFDESPVEGIDSEGITLFYGSTGFVDRVSRMNRWKPGVFFNPPRFAFQALREGFGENLLNYGSEILTVQELLARDLDPKGVWFIRPAHDTKAFTGALFETWEIKDWERILKDATWKFRYDTVIQVAEPKVIIRELRSFVVDGKVSTSSYYGHGMMKQPVFPEDIEYAKEMAKVYQPADIYTLDTCLLENGERKVVETNCFNSSGFYWSDIHKLVADVNHFLLERYSY
jgi:hypothetical protein